METTAIQEENEKKKEYLKSYRRAIKREQDILDEIQRLRLDKMFPSVVNDGMPHGSSHSDLSDYVAILDEDRPSERGTSGKGQMLPEDRKTDQPDGE